MVCRRLPASRAAWHAAAAWSTIAAGVLGSWLTAAAVAAVPDAAAAEPAVLVAVRTSLQRRALVADWQGVLFGDRMLRAVELCSSIEPGRPGSAQSARVGAFAPACSMAFAVG